MVVGGREGVERPQRGPREGVERMGEFVRGEEGVDERVDERTSDEEQTKLNAEYETDRHTQH